MVADLCHVAPLKKETKIGQSCDFVVLAFREAKGKVTKI
jgi:hypothetical protein